MSELSYATADVAIVESGSLRLLPVGDGGYELGAPLATGGMAELLIARRVGPGGVSHPVVVKRLREEMLRDRTVVRMFEWEAWIASRLRHPHVVRFHDFVVADGRHHLVLEYVHGCDLARLARLVWRGGAQIPLSVAVEVATAVALALQHAHELRDDAGRRVGLVHRDVSPHNVVLSTDGEAKLIDFGVAKTTSVMRDTGAGLIKGKMGYHAPEQLRGEPIDGRSDLFGLGVILCELVTGHRFYTSADGLQALLAPRVPPVIEQRPECPASLVEVIRRALSPTPRGRFQDARAMAVALREVRRELARETHAEVDLGTLVGDAIGEGPVPASARDPALVVTTPRARLRHQSSPPPDGRTPITEPDCQLARLRAR